LLCTYRPGYHHPFGDRTYHTRLALTNLSAADSAQMAQAMLDSASLPEALATLIVRKAEGNPFFVEEVVKSLQEVGDIRLEEGRYVLARPLDEIVVPGMIQDVLMARIDRLAEAPKQTLQLAAVIGREFTHRLLDRLADIQIRTETSLQEIKALELIHEKSLFPELSYMFKHALTLDVAYNSLLVQRRKALHRSIGRAIEDLYADRLPEQYAVLAYHFVRGEEWAKVLTYLLKAAEKAAAAFALREAIALYDQALEVAGHLGPTVDVKTRMTIHRRKAAFYFTLNDFESCLAEHERCLRLARQVGDRVSEGAALTAMGWTALWAYDFERALILTQQGIAVAKEMDAQRVLASGHFNNAWVYGLTGRLPQAQEEITQALTVSQAVGDMAHQAAALGFAGLLKNWEGDYAEAARLQSEGVRIARERKLLLPLLNGLVTYSFTLVGKGDFDEALAMIEEGLSLTEKLGHEVAHHRLLNTLGWLYFELDNLEYALNWNQRGAAAARARGDAETIANAELNLGDTLLAQGNLLRAQEVFEGVHRLVHDPATSDWMKWRYSIHLCASLGELWLARENPSKAHEFADHCLQMAARTHSRKYLIKAWQLKGEIALAGHQWAEAESAMHHALTIAQAIRNPTQLWKTHLTMGRLYSATQRHEQARQAYRAARDVLDQLKAQLQTPELRASLEHSPLMQRVYEMSTSD
jgi:tetratricopeptide (TPR) repeat protein